MNITSYYVYNFDSLLLIIALTFIVDQITQLVLLAVTYIACDIG